MTYKRIKSYGKRFGGGSYHSGYVKPSRDPIEPYRRPSSPETQYSRNLRNTLLRSGGGPSVISSPHYEYKTKLRNVEGGISKKDVEAIIESRLEEMKEVPHEFMFREMGDPLEIKEKMPKAFEDRPENETLAELNERRQQKVNEKRLEANKATTLDELESKFAEINDINQKFFDQIDEVETRTDTEKMLSDLNDLDNKADELISDSYDQLVDIGKMERRIERMKKAEQNILLDTELQSSDQLEPDTDYQRRRSKYDSELGT